MVASDKKLIAQAVASQAADEVERVLLEVLDHGFGEVNLKVSVVNGQVAVYKVSPEKTFKPSLN